MTNAGWSIVSIAAHLLPQAERETALGDVLEAGETACQALLDVLNLALYRQATLWRTWRPWLAAFGLTVPNSFLLMGVSVSVSETFLQSDNGLADLLCRAFLLLACSWAGGFAAALVSRRTLWVTASACIVPCLCCLTTFRMESLSRISLLLFLPPALMGVRRGLQTPKMKSSFALILALAITISITLTSSSLLLSSALLWPAWYLVASTRDHGRNHDPAKESTT